jgi:hypothetical protein
MWLWKAGKKGKYSKNYFESHVNIYLKKLILIV